MTARRFRLATLVRTRHQWGALAGTALGYTLLYLWLSGDLAGGGQGGVRATFPAWSRVLETRSPLHFEPVGLIELGPLVWTFSPLNLLLALLLGLLVGLNGVAAWRLWRAPRTCSLGGAGLGLLGSLPALLVGGACCAPLVLVWLGLPLAGTLAGLSSWLLPLALLLLSTGLWAMARRLSRLPRQG